MVGEIAVGQHTISRHHLQVQPNKTERERERERSNQEKSPPDTRRWISQNNGGRRVMSDQEGLNRGEKKSDKMDGWMEMVTMMTMKDGREGWMIKRMGTWTV